MNELSLFRRDPFAFTFDTNLPRLMRDLMRFEDVEAARPPVSFVPRFDVKETPEAFELHADLPGVRSEDLDVSVNGNQLSVSGKRLAEAKKDGENYHQVERSYGTFTRVFTLPDNVNPDVQAELKDGVLRLTIPKRPESKPRQISVKTS